MYYLLGNNDIVEESRIEFINGEDWRSIDYCDYFFTDMLDNPNDNRLKGVYQRIEDNNNYNTFISQCNTLNDLPHSENIIEILPQNSLICIGDEVYRFQGKDDPKYLEYLNLFNENKISAIYTSTFLQRNKFMRRVYVKEGQEYA